MITIRRDLLLSFCYWFFVRLIVFCPSFSALLFSFVFSWVFVFVLFCLLRAVPTAYGGSQARGQIGAAAASIHHSHRNTGSEMGL